MPNHILSSKGLARIKRVRYTVRVRCLEREESLKVRGQDTQLNKDGNEAGRVKRVPCSRHVKVMSFLSELRGGQVSQIKVSFKDGVDGHSVLSVKTINPQKTGMEPLLESQ